MLRSLALLLLLVAVTTVPAAAGPSADEALAMLREGNRRFQSETPQHPNEAADRRLSLVKGQSPFAVVVACSDSRVPPEVLFDCGLGDVFVIRTAGNVIDEAALGSVQYAVLHLHSSLVLVLGHEGCGAVSGALAGGGGHGDDEPEALGHLLGEIARTVAGAKNLDEAIWKNIAASKNRLRDDDAIRGAIARGQTRLVGAYYSMTSGLVSFDDGH